MVNLKFNLKLSYPFTTIPAVGGWVAGCGS